MDNLISLGFTIKYGFRGSKIIYMWIILAKKSLIRLNNKK